MRPLFTIPFASVLRVKTMAISNKFPASRISQSNGGNNRIYNVDVYSARGVFREYYRDMVKG